MKNVKKMWILYFLILLTLSSVTWAATKPISGYVNQNDGTAAQNASVVVYANTTAIAELECMTVPAVYSGSDGSYATNLGNLKKVSDGTTNCNGNWQTGDKLWAVADGTTVVPDQQGNGSSASSESTTAGTGLQTLANFSLAAGPDLTDPSIFLLSPVDHSNSTTGNVVFQYNVTDSSSITNCTFSLNRSINQTDTSITKNIAQSFSLNMMPDGHYNWSINCTDSADNQNRSVYRFLNVSKIGTLQVSLITPTTDTSVAEKQFFKFTVQVRCLEGSCGDVNASLDPISYGQDQQEGFIETIIGFFKEFLSGNLITGWAAGGLVPTSATEPFWTNSSNPANNTHFSCLDDMAMDSACNVTWWVNASGVPGNKSDFFAFVNSTTSSSLHNASAHINITITDETLPSVFNLTPVAGSTFNVSNMIEIGANVTDDQVVGTVLANITHPNGSITQLTLTNGTDHIQRYNSTFTIPYAIGQYTVRFIANDSANNINSSETTTFTAADITPPNVTTLLPATGSTFNVSNTIQIASDVTDDVTVASVFANITYPNGSINRIQLSNHSTYIDTYNASFTIPTLLGLYNITFIANDTSNNRNRTQTTLFTAVDADAPKFSDVVELPSDPATYSTDQIYRFNITITDNIALGPVRIEFNGTNYSQEISNTSSIFMFNRTDLAAGTYKYRWYANDSSNRSNFSAQTYTINRASSAVNLTIDGDDANKTVEFGSIVNLTGTRIIGEGDIQLYRNNSLLNTGSPMISNRSIFSTLGSFNITALYEESQNYSFSNETHYVSVIDTIRPNVTEVTTSPTIINQTQSVSINATVLDRVSVDTVIAQINYPNGSIFNYTMSNTVSMYNVTVTTGISWPIGQYNVTVIANDTSNYVNNSETTSFIVNDVTSPSVIGLVPANGTTTTTGSVIELSANISDNTGVGNVSFNVTYPNSTILSVTASQASGDKYNTSFTVPSAVGEFTFKVIAGDNSPQYYFSQPIAEMGTANLSTGSTWKQVNLTLVFTNPVVIPVPLTHNGGTPAEIRITNISNSSFFARSMEPNYGGDENHGNEQIGFIVVEEGVHTLADGTKVEAYSFNTSTLSTNDTVSFDSKAFNHTYDATPIVLSHVQTYNDSNFVTTAQSNVTSGGFNISLEVGSDTPGTHSAENIGYVVWEAGSGSVNNIAFEAGISHGVVKGSGDGCFAVSHNLGQVPSVVVAQTHTRNDTEGGWVRYCNNDNTHSSSNIYLEIEEVNGDGERNHDIESVGFIVFSSEGTFSEEVGVSSAGINSIQSYGTNMVITSIDSVAFDTSRNQNNTEFTVFTVEDSTAPVLSNINESPTDPATYVPDQIYWFNVTITDDVAVGEVLIQFNGTNYSSEVTNISSTYIFNRTDLAVSEYSYTWHVNDTSDNSNSSEQTYTINRASSSVNLTLDGTDGNVTVQAGATVNLSGTKISGEGSGEAIKLYLDGGLLNQGLSFISNLSTFSSLGSFNITALYEETQNYSFSNETHFVSVIDTTKPNVTNVSATPSTINQTNSTQINATVTDNLLVGVVIAQFTLPNGTVINQTMSNTSSRYNTTFTTTLNDPTGIYTVRIIANDTENNINKSETTSFTVSAGSDNDPPAITIHSPIGEDNTTKLQFLFNVSSTETGTLWYNYNSQGNITLCHNCSIASTVLNATNFGNQTITAYGNDSANNLANAQRNFTIDIDSDDDGIYDRDEDDDDDDGIPDVNDTLRGNVSNINTHYFESINFTVNNSDNLSQRFTGTLPINITNGSHPYVESIYNFSANNTCILANITVRKQPKNSTKGSTLVRAICAIPTKTVYVDDISDSMNSVCVKDLEITSLSQISSDCSTAGEVRVACPGTASGFTCTDLGTRYRVEGLSYSGITETADTPSGSSSTSSSGGGGGSSSGGGGTIIPQPAEEEESPAADEDGEVSPEEVVEEAPVEEAEKEPGEIEEPAEEGPQRTALYPMAIKFNLKEIVRDLSVWYIIAVILAWIFFFMMIILSRKKEKPEIIVTCPKRIALGRKMKVKVKIINGDDEVKVRLWGFIIKRAGEGKDQCPPPGDALYKIDLEKNEKRTIFIPIEVPLTTMPGKYSLLTCCEINYLSRHIPLRYRKKTRVLVDSFRVVTSAAQEKLFSFVSFTEHITQLFKEKQVLPEDIAIELQKQKDLQAARMREIELERTKRELLLKLKRQRKLREYSLQKILLEEKMKKTRQENILIMPKKRKRRRRIRLKISIKAYPKYPA